MVLSLVICFLVAVILALLGSILSDWLVKKIGSSYKDSIDKAGVPIVTFKNGNQSLNFLLDTGSDMSHIDTSVVKSLEDIETTKGDSVAIYTANGFKEGNNDWIRIPLKYRGQYYSEEFMPLDLHETFNSIKEETGIQLHGILGVTFLRNYRYVLDFDKMIAYTK